VLQRAGRADEVSGSVEALEATRVHYFEVLSLRKGQERSCRHRKVCSKNKWMHAYGTNAHGCMKRAQDVLFSMQCHLSCAQLEGRQLGHHLGFSPHRSCLEITTRATAVRPA
jgi:hypothetical protein